MLPIYQLSKVIGQPSAWILALLIETKRQFEETEFNAAHQYSLEQGPIADKLPGEIAIGPVSVNLSWDQPFYGAIKIPRDATRI